MIPYYALIFLPIIYSFLRFKGQEAEKRNKIAIGIFFFIFLTMLMLRDVSIGRDLPVYKGFFGAYGHMDWSDAMSTDMEQGFAALYKVVWHFTDDFQWFIVITAIITVVPIWYTYNRLIEDPALSIGLFLILPTFVMSFSGLRQVLAISAGMVAYEMTRKHKLIPFILTVVLAFSFHRSAFILLFMYPLYHAKITKKWLLVVVPAMGIIYLFNKPIFGFLNSLIAEYFEGDVTETGAYMMLVLFILFAVYSFVVTRDTDLDDETIGLRNFILMAVAIQMFAPLHSLAMRMNYYYIIFIPLLIPKIIKHASPNWFKPVWVSRYVMTLFFLFYFFDHAPSGNILDTFPYKFFWEG